MIWVKRAGIAIVSLVLWLALAAALVSKERLCNAVINSVAHQENITLCYDGRTTTSTGCTMRYVHLLFAHSAVAKIKTFSATPWRITAEGIRLEGMAADAWPPRIKSFILSPWSGRIHAEGDFGILDGTFSVAKRRVALQLTPSSIMRRQYRSTLRMFKQKNGKFVYETAF
ncbi:hypothetical protein [Hydrogenimonas urashimensis]|uniref:hypothetical protein n=1 Tax=Hydrogenimonas urashimensis TaxID=2740515 RepID=UPI001915A7F0|nr:hypothetical protein [Hydrogenimonas urashimensis]